MWGKEKLMNEYKKSSRALGPLLFAFAAVAGLALGACMEDDDDDWDPPLEVRNSCEDYCAQAKLCDDDVNEQNCRDKCTNAMGNCQTDELDIAVDELRQCSNETCDDFVGCTISVGAQCAFGI